MKELVGEKLPRFTSEETEDLKQSIDFIGLNYYFAMWATKRKEETPFGIHAWRDETQCEFHCKFSS
jgi:beta-glucosidase/6-phospho-beta-glucosidase/beta-galactosidase